MIKTIIEGIIYGLEWAITIILGTMNWIPTPLRIIVIAILLTQGIIRIRKLFT